MTYPLNRSFRRAQASRSTRRINPRARGSGRGMTPCLLPSWDHTRRVVYESILEMRVLHLLLARPDFWDLWEQPERIRYVDADGNAKSTVFDFLVTLRSGRKIAIAVKPAAIVEETGFRQELELIRAATPLSFADDVVLVTDRSFTAAVAPIVTFLLCAAGDISECAAATHFACNLSYVKYVSIADLL